MSYPIVKVTTRDGITLHGLLSEPKIKSKNIVIHIHGSGGSFYWNDFYPFIAKSINDLNYSFLSVNTRGAGVYEIETGSKPYGTAIELFEDCLIDINSWIEFAFSKGYKNIILEGHSFGTNKVQYYTLYGKYKSDVKALILLGFTDSYGGQLAYLKKNNIKNEDILNEAKKLNNEGKPTQLLSNLHINWGELPQSAQSYINFMSPNSNLSKILPLGTSKTLENFRKINIPVLGVVGDHNECTVIPPQQAVNLLNKENINAKCYMIKDCSHGYKGKENEVTKLIESFINSLSI